MPIAYGQAHWIRPHFQRFFEGHTDTDWKEKEKSEFQARTKDAFMKETFEFFLPLVKCIKYKIPILNTIEQGFLGFLYYRESLGGWLGGVSSRQ